MKTTNEDINIVRLTKGAAFIRYEIARGCPVASRHGSHTAPTTLDLSEAREDIARHVAAGWRVSAV